MYVYFIQNSRLGHIKIGIAHNPIKRLKELQSASSVTLELLYVVKCKNKASASKTEWRLHRHFYENRLKGEWFDITVKDIENLNAPLVDGSQFIESRPTISKRPSLDERTTTCDEDIANGEPVIDLGPAWDRWCNKLV